MGEFKSRVVKIRDAVRVFTCSRILPNFAKVRVNFEVTDNFHLDIKFLIEILRKTATFDFAIRYN